MKLWQIVAILLSPLLVIACSCDDDKKGVR